MNSFTTPKMKEYPTIPVLIADASQHISPFPANGELNESLGYPAQLPENWQQIVLDKMSQLMTTNRAFRIFLDSCMKCGACSDKCHYFLGTQDPKNMPVARQDLMRSVYRRYFTFSGKYFPRLVGAIELTEEVLEQWYQYYYQCSQCRRCAVFCPIGIDTAEITMAAREILSSVGKASKNNQQIIHKVLNIGNNLGLPTPALKSILQDIEQEVEEETGIAVKYHLDMDGCEALLVTASADFFAEPHVDGLIGYGKVLHHAGISWTLSSIASEAANFALFMGSTDNMQQIAMRIKEAAIELKVKRIIFGECGHAWRVASNFLQQLLGPFDFLDEKYQQAQHIVEITQQLIINKQIRFNKQANAHLHVTFHDSCNIARASRMGEKAGDQFSYPRQIIQACCDNFTDMALNTTKQQTFCCGGGGGTLSDDLIELRVKGALPRMEAYNQVVKNDGVTHLVAICAICKSQFATVLPYYGFAREDILSLHQLVSNAIVLQGSIQEKELN